MTILANTESITTLDPFWRAIALRISCAERNLDELQPGPNEAMRRIINGQQPDFATSSADAIERDVAQLRIILPRLARNVANFDYPVSGEATVDATLRQPLAAWVNQHAPAGCVNCGQADTLKYSPVAMRRNDRGDLEVDGSLCTWCRDFERSSGVLPTPALIVAHHDGKRMTKALVEPELAAAREAKKQALLIARRDAKKARKGHTGNDVEQQQQLLQSPVLGDSCALVGAAGAGPK